MFGLLSWLKKETNKDKKPAPLTRSQKMCALQERVAHETDPSTLSQISQEARQLSPVFDSMPENVKDTFDLLLAEKELNKAIIQKTDDPDTLAQACHNITSAIMNDFKYAHRFNRGGGTRLVDVIGYMGGNQYKAFAKECTDMMTQARNKTQAGSKQNKDIDVNVKYMLRDPEIAVLFDSERIEEEGLIELEGVSNSLLDSSLSPDCKHTIYDSLSLMIALAKDNSELTKDYSRRIATAFEKRKPLMIQLDESRRDLTNPLLHEGPTEANSAIKNAIDEFDMLKVAYQEINHSRLKLVA